MPIILVFKKLRQGWVWWHMTLIQELSGSSDKDFCEFEAILVYILRPYLKKKIGVGLGLFVLAVRMVQTRQPGAPIHLCHCSEC